MSGSAPSSGTDVLTPAAHEPLKLKLSVISGPDFGLELVLEKGTYRIGKDPSNHLVLTDSAVSRTHLLVGVLAEGVKLTDNGSTNGSFCEGMRFTTLSLKPGATVRIGRSVLKLLPRTSLAPALPPSPRDSFGGLQGDSLRMRELFAVLERVSPKDSDVLIHGETGTGKEKCAQAIHQNSGRRHKPFVVCDLSSIAPTLFESEIFGHVKGAFTGAVANRVGAFERANGGTVFLDEVGEIPLEVQPRLLGALERRQVRPLGSDAYIATDVRVISASHKDLEAEVKAGKLRSDLFHRLAVVKIELPALRERPEDIPRLIDEVLKDLGMGPEFLAPETRAMLCDYSWPGNVRELRNVVERAVSLGGDPGLPMPESEVNEAQSAAVQSVPYKEAKEKLLLAFEKDYLSALLKKHKGNVTRAAEEAKIARVYLHTLIKKHQLLGLSDDS